MLDKDYYFAEYDYKKAVLKGVEKIASKMGISTIQFYQGSTIFEAVGISKEVIDHYFKGIVNRIGKIMLENIEKRTQVLHQIVSKIIFEYKQVALHYPKPA